jgi:hypothetical protein
VHNNTGGEFQEVRQIKEKRIGEEGGARAHQSCRDRADTPADAADSGKEFCSPRCGSSGEAKGERERTPGAIYRRGAGTKRAGIKQELNRGGE